MSKKGNIRRQFANQLIKRLNAKGNWTIPGESKPDTSRKVRKANVFHYYQPESLRKQQQQPKNGFIKYRVFEIIFRQMGDDGKLITWPCYWTAGPKGRYNHTDKDIELVSIKRYGYPGNKKITKVRVIKKALFKTELKGKWRRTEDLIIGGIFNGSQLECVECNGYGYLHKHDYVWNQETEQYDLKYGPDCPNCTDNPISYSIIR